ncbi:MAG TPA: glycosyltransferase family 25 protein [Stellaceae bacterium]|nr:glycosyltransferase family 25 protein [Stellaceae bacterium]
MLTCLINLDRSPERLARFMATNGHLTNVARFPAIDGRAANADELIRAGIIRPETVARYSPSDLGCALSHIALWERIQVQGEPITVCEDDAVFNLHFETASKRALALLPPDWDLILWGWNFNGGLLFELLPGVSPCLSVFDEGEMRRGVENFRTQSYPVSPFRLRQAFGTVCYSVSPKGARALREHCLPLRDAAVYCVVVSREMQNYAIDIAMMGQYPKLNAFVGFPPLVLTSNEREASSSSAFQSNVNWEKPEVTDLEVERAGVALERMHGCRARLAKTVTVSERLDDGTAFAGQVYLFDLYGLAEPKQAYAWWVPRDSHGGTQFMSILRSTETGSPSVAVKAALAASRGR